LIHFYKREIQISIMSTKEQQTNQLLDMGFGNNRVVRALQATGFKGVEPAMEWLLAHSDDASLDEPFTEEEGLQMKSSLETPAEPAKKPLTEEEKQEKLVKLEELRQKKKLEREEREKQEAREKEMKRIASGKEMSNIKQTLAEQEIKKMAEQRRREKQEEREAKAKVLAQLEADKAARRAEREASKSQQQAPPVSASPQQSQPPAVRKDYSEARLQIRQTNGQPLVHTFGAKESLSAVRLYVEMNRTDGVSGQVKLMTNFPKKVFSDDDYDNSLENLGLVPSAVLMMTK